MAREGFLLTRDHSPLFLYADGGVTQHHETREQAPKQKEDEVLVLHVDTEALKDKLESRGAEKKFEGIIEDVYFDTPNGILDSRGITLRVRKMTPSNGGEPEYEFTVKKKQGRNGDSFVREEDNTTTTSEGEVIRLLNQYIRSELPELHGKLVRSLHKSKHRTSYKLDEVGFDVDTPIMEHVHGKEREDLSFIEPIVEVEILYRTDEEKERLDEKRAKLMEEFGLEPCEHSSWSYGRIIDYYRQKRDESG